MQNESFSLSRVQDSDRRGFGSGEELGPGLLSLNIQPHEFEGASSGDLFLVNLMELLHQIDIVFLRLSSIKKNNAKGAFNLTKIKYI